MFRFIVAGGFIEFSETPTLETIDDARKTLNNLTEALINERLNNNGIEEDSGKIGHREKDSAV